MKFISELNKMENNMSMCNICYTDYIGEESFVYCPYWNEHKWCDNCSKSIRKCPFCRKSLVDRRIIQSQEISSVRFRDVIDELIRIQTSDEEN